MRKTGAVLVMAMVLLCGAQSGFGQALAVKPGNTLQDVAEAHKGKKVTVRLQSGEEMTGTIKTVTKELMHLSELTGKEFYDAVIDLNKVTAIVFRAK